MATMKCVCFSIITISTLVLADQIGDNVGTGFIQDFLFGNFLRSPVAAVVDTHVKSVQVLKNLWPNIDTSIDRDISLFLVKSTGVVKLMETQVGNASGIFSSIETEPPADFDELQESGPLFLGAFKAVQHIPFDSGVLLVAANAPNDEDLAKLLLLGLLHKRSRLFVVWTKGQDEGEEALKQIALQSGGSFYYYNEDTLITKRTSKIDYDDRNKTTIQGEIKETEKKDDSQADTAQRSKRFAFPTKDEDNSTNVKSFVLNDVNKPEGQQQQKALRAASVLLTVELAPGSNLELRPNVQTHIQYQITNLQFAAGWVQLQAYGQGVTIANVNPPQLFLDPQASAIVQISVRPLTQTGGQISITLRATTVAGATTATISRTAQLYVTNGRVTDTWAPEISWKFGADCANFNKPSNCENGIWTIDLTAKDETSGLLRFMSEPFGMNFNSEFIAGTKSPVSATYTASCCRPRVDVWAEDLKGNYNRKTFDVFNQVLLPGEIAAVVLGILLLILLVALIVLLVFYCRKRNSDRLVLPRHRDIK